MSRSSYKLKLQKNGVTYNCELYTTPQEARDNLYHGKYVRFQKNGVNLYAPLTTVLNSATESTPVLVYKKGDSTKYCIAQKAFYRANVTAVANAVITAKAYNESNVEIASWTSGAKWFPYGTKITASGVGNPSNIWQNPTLAIERGYNTNNKMTVSNVEISAVTAVTRKTYNVTVTPGSHQTITFKYTEPGKNLVTVSVGSARTFTLLAGTTWTASITADTGYNAGTLNKKSGTVTDGTTSISAGSASLKTFTLKLNGTSGQTITLKYTQPGSSEVTRTSTSSAQSWTVKYGTTWRASLAASTGYRAGTLSGSSGTVTANVTVSASSATAITPSITFNWVKDDWMPTNETVTYTNAAGTRVTVKKPSSVTIKYNTNIMVTCKSKYSTRQLQIKQGGTVKSTIPQGRSWTSGKFTSGAGFTLTGIYKSIYEPSSGDGDSPGGADGD